MSSCRMSAAASWGTIKGIAVSVVSEFIASPDVFQFDLQTSPAVQQLEKDSQYAALYSLLGILLDGNVKVANNLQ